MTLSRLGVGATLSFGILCVWLGACSSDATQPCGNTGELQGTCQSTADAANDGCPSGMVEVNTTDSLSTGCAPTYTCCATPSATAAQQGSGSASGS